MKRWKKGPELCIKTDDEGRIIGVVMRKKFWRRWLWSWILPHFRLVHRWSRLDLIVIPPTQTKISVSKALSEV